MIIARFSHGHKDKSVPHPQKTPQFLKDLAEIPVNNADGFLFRTILQMALHQQNLQFPVDGIP